MKIRTVKDLEYIGNKKPIVFKSKEQTHSGVIIHDINNSLPYLNGIGSPSRHHF